MPWAIFNRPSIQLGALKSYINSQAPDIEVTARHPYLETAADIGFDAYRIISGDSWAGEALYCALLFPERTDRAREVFYRSLGRKTASALPAFDLLRAQLDRQLDNWLAANDFSGIDLAGFTVCFAQLPASLLAAQRMKKKYPDIKVVFGGSTCVPETGASLLQAFAQIDYVITGEGEQPLLNLCRFLQGKTTTLSPAILRATTSAASPQSAGTEIHDLNSLPVPDYAGYFKELKHSRQAFIPQLPVEFSRGCWWNKCAFCNLNLQWCGYRFKKSERMLEEVTQLAAQYRCLDFAFTDNALPPAEADRFFAAMGDMKKDIRFFAEIRTANRPEQYANYRQGGLDSVQIGIEAFSGALLQRMNKGVTVMDNLAAMKYCAEAGIQLDGNLILEFPGSTGEEVRETLRVLEFALPFRPLAGAGFFLGLGSPAWSDPGRYNITAVRRHPFNRKLYPEPLLNKLKLLVNQGAGDRKRQQHIWRPVRKKIKEWATFHQNRTKTIPPLSCRDGGDFIIIRQERPGEATQHHRLTGISRKIYLACAAPVTTKTLLGAFNSVTEKALTAFLDDLEEKKLVFRDRDQCLALAVRRPMP